MTFYLGRLPADPNKLKLELKPKAAITPPPNADWTSGVPSFPMFGNDVCGDCTMAAAAHSAELISYYGQGKEDAIPDGTAVQAYSQMTGYDPKTGANDNGATLQEALDYWRKTGIAGNKIVAAAKLDASNLDLVRACIAYFGSVYTGMYFPGSAMNQFDKGQEWTVVRSQIEGGHCVPIAGYESDKFVCVTWAKTQTMDLNFFKTYFDEVWVPIDLDWINKQGAAPNGFNIAKLNSDYSALTGKQAPFPKVTPQPNPQPNPTQDADSALFEAQSAWRAGKGFTIDE